MPPDRYYFPGYANEVYTNPNNIPYGTNKCLEYRNAIAKADTEVSLWDRYLTSTYELSAGGAFATFDASVRNVAQARGLDGDRNWYTVDPVKVPNNAIREQYKVSAALLFQSICEYPRMIKDFTNNPSYNDFVAQINLDASFQHNCNQDPGYKKAIRFRNWMRYGVATRLLNTKLKTFTVPQIDTTAYEASFDAGTAQVVHTINRFTTTWNKVNPKANTLSPDAPFLDADNYSFFDITKGLFSYVANAYNPNVADLTAADADSRCCRTIFQFCPDNGNALLREPGAFLAPNHFHHSNEDYTYKSVGSFLGANLIITKEISDALLGTSKPTNRFLENTRLLHIINNINSLNQECIDEIFEMMNNAWEYVYGTPKKELDNYNQLMERHVQGVLKNLPANTSPQDQLAAMRRARADFIATATAAAAAAGGPQIPTGPNFNRIQLTRQFTIGAEPVPAVPISQTNNIVNWLIGRFPITSFTNTNIYRDHVWLWEHVINTRDEIWKQPGTDYRLNIYDAASPNNTRTLTAAEIIQDFPQFQPGSSVIYTWRENLNQSLNNGNTTAPTFLQRRQYTHPYGVNTNNIATKTTFNSKWAFTRTLTNLPETTTMNQSNKRSEVLNFLFQIYTRYVFDQSEAPVVHASSQYTCFEDFIIANTLPMDPFPRQRTREPFYRGIPGGMYARGMAPQQSPLENDPLVGLPGDADTRRRRPDAEIGRAHV